MFNKSSINGTIMIQLFKRQVKEYAMKAKASEFLLSKKEQLKEIVQRLASEYDYVSILGTDVSGNSYAVETSGTQVMPSPDAERGFVIRVFSQGYVSEYSCSKLDVECVIKRVNEVVTNDRVAFNAVNAPLHYNKLPADQPLAQSFYSELKNDPASDSPGDIIKTLTNVHDHTKLQFKEVVQLGVGLDVTQVNKIFVSKNRDLYQSYVYATAFGFAVAQEQEDTKVAFDSSSGLIGSEIIDDIERLAKTAAQHAVEMLGSNRVEAGIYDIICDPDFSGLIAHEAFGHGAEMDMFVKNRAMGAKYVNQRVASDHVMMHDGARAYDEVSSYLFDDEGNLGTDTIIINQGILTSGIADQLAALQLGVAPTGNGKRSNYKRKSYTRMTNTFFAAGNDSLEDMIKSIDKGYLLEGFSSGMEDPKNWGIQCVAEKGREIIDGKLTGKIVSPVYLTGYVPDLLNSISMVSPDLRLSGGGYCGKGWKEWVKTSTGGSFIKAKGRLS